MAYLTVVEYVARFGERETTLLTNEAAVIGSGLPVYDAAKVLARIEDATEEVEGYIGTRYATPLASPPPIVKGWVADIARLKLAEGTGRVSEAIKAAADRTTRQLERLVDGKLNLPIPEGVTPPTPLGTGDASSSMDRPASVFGTLDTFLAPFNSGCDVPRWRQGC